MNITVITVTLITSITIIITMFMAFKYDNRLVEEKTLKEELRDKVWKKQQKIDELNIEIHRLKREIQIFNKETTISPEAKERYNREWGLKPGDWGYLD